jgi:hypothetical protein
LLFTLVFTIWNRGGPIAGDAEAAATGVGRSASVLYEAIVYIPNRAFDLIDTVRLRTRVGPGLAAGVRVTSPLEVFAGGYGGLFAGLPGPRMRRLPRLPVGLESRNGAALSFVELTADFHAGPHYSPTEIEAGLHLLLVGFDAGVDPVEVADFVGGWLLIDIRGDDW